MTHHTTRRDLLRSGLTLAGLSAIGLPDWILPALAQGDVPVAFTDIPANFNPTPTPERRTLDLRTVDGAFTPSDRFFTIQHNGHPKIDAAAFRLKVDGLVARPVSLSVDDLRHMGSTELVAGFECSGNRRPLQGLVSNGRWTGLPLRTLLDRVGVKAEAREFVFFGADRAEEDVEFRDTKFKVEQQFGRSLPREIALSREPFLAYALNGEPLSVHQGAPVRLIVPGWYGVANVKWLSDIHVQSDEFLGKFQARWYRTLIGESVNGEMKWTERAVTRMQLKSFIARVTRNGSVHKILGVALNDGTPLKSVEVQVDNGPWRSATWEPSTNGKFSWKLFTYEWRDATPGEHTLVSRVTDINGKVQPTAADLENKKTFLEDNAQTPRKVLVG